MLEFAKLSKEFGNVVNSTDFKDFEIWMSNFEVFDKETCVNCEKVIEGKTIVCAATRRDG